jgi:hypothetical protein
MKKTILLVAMPGSIHTAKWAAQLHGQDWSVHLFPSNRGEAIHPAMADITVHHLLYSERLPSERASSSANKSSVLALWFDRFRVHIFDRCFPMHRVRQLTRLISRLRPDMIHSMEMQAGGYLTLEAKKRSSDPFPPWLVTLWGSDIFLFGRLAGHREKIRDVLAECDYFSCECKRDVELARELGLKGVVASSGTSVTGGFSAADLEISKNACLTAGRKVIVLKGYQHWAGRALFGLRALERCADLLFGYEIVIYSAMPDVALAATLFSEKERIPIRVLSQGISHGEILALHASARISIGLSISDGISVSLLEAMAMGSFPIQSCTACANEWIEHGVSGMIVPPEDPDIIEIAIRTALSDDELVNRAAEINRRVVQERMGSDRLKQEAIDMYSRILLLQKS